MNRAVLIKRRHTYTIYFKLEVKEIAKKHRIGADERKYRSAKTRKMS